MSDFRIVYLSGPRQAGKTTLARRIAEQLGFRYFSLDDQAVLGAIRSDPQGFIRSLEPIPVVLDEFQYAPELISAIKQSSDRLGAREKGRFLLTGSADIFRSAKTQEALPGHMARLELYPLSISELSGSEGSLIDHLIKGKFRPRSVPFWSREEIAEKILAGGYPEPQGKSARTKSFWFRSYLEGRLFKDFEFLHAARGDYYSKLRALTPYLAGLTGNLLKFASLANDLKINDRLAKRYVEILELMYLLKRLPSYRKNRAKRIATEMSKLHFIDTGLACNLLRLNSPEQLLQSGHYGPLFENLVFSELLKQVACAPEPCELYHFRDKRQREVDLVLEYGWSRVIGIEVKASASVRAEDFRNLAHFAETAGAGFDRGVLIYTGDEILPFRYGQHRFHALPVSLLGEL